MGLKKFSPQLHKCFEMSIANFLIIKVPLWYGTLKISREVQKWFYMKNLNNFVIQLLSFESVVKKFHKKKHNWFEILICYWTLRI